MPRNKNLPVARFVLETNLNVTAREIVEIIFMFHKRSGLHRNLQYLGESEEKPKKRRRGGWEGKQASVKLYR